MAQDVSVRINEYKQNIIQEILMRPEITSMIDDTVDPSELLYNNIFPFVKIPGAIDIAKTYITIEASMPRSSMINSSYREMVITITIICHDDLMYTDTGMTRIDYLGIAIEKLFDKSTKLGIGEAEVLSNIEGVWSEKHSFRELRFKVKDFSASRCYR